MEEKEGREKGNAQTRKGAQEGKPDLRRGVQFITPNNEYYRSKNLGFGWAIKQENEREILWGEV